MDILIEIKYTPDYPIEIAGILAKGINYGDGKNKTTIATIERVVCKYYNITPDIIKKNTRKREVVQARQIAMFFAFKKTNNSSTKIGQYFGGKDHATTLHAKKTVYNLIDTDKKIRHQIEQINRML